MLMNLNPDPNERKAARERLLEITQFQSLDVDNPAEREELAETLLSLGIIQAGRGRVPTAKRMLTRAKSLFGRDTEGAKRADNELKLLDPPRPPDSAPQ